jgi:ribosomal protein S18 acetylase RimI-like enzyme
VATRATAVAESLEWARAAIHGLAGAEPGAQGADGATATDTPSLTAWALDADTRLAGLLAAAGLTPDEAPTYTHWHRQLAGGPPVPAPRLPTGYRLDHVRLPDDLEARVEAHRSAFAPSKLTLEKYRALVSQPHYAPDRDLVVRAPDGSIAAFAMAWWDPDAGVGAFEPVGTHADHRERGLARAVNLAGLALLRDLGADDAIVLSACSNAASEALYASAGFQAVTHHRGWTLAAGG